MVVMYEQEPTGEVVTAARITVRPEKRKELVMTLNSLLDEIRNEKGCRAYRFYDDDTEEDSFMLISEWDTRSDWDRHLHSEHFTILRGSLGILGNGESLDFKLLTQVGVNDALATGPRSIQEFEH